MAESKAEEDSNTNDLGSFGYEGFWGTAHNAFPRFWQVYPRLNDAGNDVLFRHYSAVGPLEKVIINLGILAGTCLSEATTLVGNGLGHGALKIVRSMVEVTINAEFIRRFPEHLDDYVDWHHVERWQTMKRLRANPLSGLQISDEQQKDIQTEFDNVKSRFEIPSSSGKPRLRQGWCSTGLPERATKIDFGYAYELYYPLGNKLLHGTIGGMAMHSNKSSESSRVGIPPSIDHCRSALIGAHTCTVQIIETICTLMKLEPSPSLATIRADYTFAWPSSAGDPDTSMIT